MAAADRAGAPGGETFVDVRVQPRASREGVVGVVAGRVRIRVNAPPVDGAANRRVVDLLAREFGVARSAVTIVSGARGRDKRLRISGVARRPDWLPP